MSKNLHIIYENTKIHNSVGTMVWTSAEITCLIKGKYVYIFISTLPLYSSDHLLNWLIILFVKARTYHGSCAIYRRSLQSFQIGVTFTFSPFAGLPD